MNPRAEAALRELLEGNRRFREGCSIQRNYTPEDLQQLAKKQNPLAAIVACSDSRCTPSIIFDQPLGALFASRIPGNVVSEGVKWMAELAVGDFRVPLLMVLGHTGCLAVQSVLEEKSGGPGGMLRNNLYPGVQAARMHPPEQRMNVAVRENAKHTVKTLISESYLVRSAVESNNLQCLPAIYEMETGSVQMVD